MNTCITSIRKTSRVSEMESIHISVKEPVSYSPNPFTTFTSFTIYVETSHPAFSAKLSSARRRFSEFRWLRRQLWRHHPHRTPPELPRRSVLSWNSFSDAFIEERRLGLQRFLREVVCVSTYLGEKALHLFLQTELSVRDIEANLLGERDDSVTELCKYWPATPRNQVSEVQVNPTKPQAITTSITSENLTAASSVSSDASDDHWFSTLPFLTSQRVTCRAPINPHCGLSSSLIC